MAKRLAIPSKEIQLQLVNGLGANVAARVQRLDFNTDIPSTTIDQLGSAAHVGDAKDTPNVTCTFSAFDVGIELFSALTNTDPDSYPGTGVDIGDLSEVDVIAYIKSATNNDYVKGAHMKRMAVRDFTFNYSVEGEATEDYTVVGSEKRWFSKNVQVDAFSTGTTSFTLTATPIVLRNGNKVLSVILDNEYLTEVASSPATGEFSVSGTTVTTFDSMVTSCVVVYQSEPAGDEWTDVPIGSSPAAIRGKDIPVEIAAANIPRVQSITINGTLNSQPVKEMGNPNIVGYVTQVPEVTGSITVLDTDVELISLLMYGVTASGTEYQPGIGCADAAVPMEIKLFDPCDSTSQVKTVYLDGITIVGDAYTSNVNQNASQTFNWKSSTGHCVVYSGAKA